MSTLGAKPSFPRPGGSNGHGPGSVILPGGMPIPRYHVWFIVLAALTGSILEVLDTTITTTAVPQMMGNLGATLSEIGWVNTGYLVANVIVLPMAGWLARRLGRRNYFCGAVLIFTVASIFCGMSQNLTTLVFWRVIQGLGGGGLLSTAQVIMLDVFPPDRRAVPTALYGAGVMAAPILGPVLGGYLTDHYAWPMVFFINIPFGLVCALATYGFVRDAPGERVGRREPIDFSGILLLAIGMGSLQTVLERGRELDWFNSNFIVALIVVSLAAGVVFTVHQLTTRFPVINLRLLRDRSLFAGTVYAWVLGLGIYGLMFLMPVYLQVIRGYSPYQSGLVQGPSGIAVMASFVVAGLTYTWLDTRWMMLLGTVGMIIGSGLLQFLTTDTPNIYVIGCLAIRGFSLGFLFVPLTLSSLANLRGADETVGASLINFTRQLGGSMGIALLSTLLDHATDIHRSTIYSHLGGDNSALAITISGAQMLLRHEGYSAASAHHLAVYYVSQLAERQAGVMAFNDCFGAIALAFVCALPLILLFARGRGDTGLVVH